MLDLLPKIQVDGHSLLAVPAVHYRATFAEQVNSACFLPATRPDAIAVELGPSAVAAVATWLREMGVGPERKTDLPCMFGLIHINRRIRPELKGIVIKLQEATGKHLHELPPSLLQEHLGFAALSLLSLSSTDSIIEAIRCGLELDLPLYGVDLDDFAQVNRIPLMIQDPVRARGRLCKYVTDNARFSEKGRHEEVDGRRELVMAARLKALLQRHDRVLFTGGIGHWRNLERRLQDPSLSPAAEVPTTGTANYFRVLVHPLLATYQMDIFPEVTAWYERLREPPNRRRGLAKDFIDLQRLFRALLTATYEWYFIPSEVEQQLERKVEDYEGIPAFESLMANVCAVGQRAVPDLFTTLEVAESTMSPRFCAALAKTIMDFDWASPLHWPDLPIVCPGPSLEAEGPRNETAQRAELLIPRKTGLTSEDKIDYVRTRPFYIACIPEGERRSVSVKNPWQWTHEPSVVLPLRHSGQSRTWPPWDFLVQGMASQAAQVARSTSPERHVEVFEGSLFEGIDMKATLRANIRGDHRVYVRTDPPRTQHGFSPESTFEPTVFIFFRPRENETASWYLHGGSMTKNYKEHVQDLNRLDEVRRRKGDQCVQGVSFTEAAPIPDHMRGHVVGINLLRGIVLFGNPAFNSIQEAKWLEDTDYSRWPIHEGESFSDLMAMYALRYGVKLDPSDWPTSLIRIAIPYAQHYVTVVAPDHFIFPSIVFRDARRHRIQLAIVPMSYLPSERLRKVRTQYVVMPEDKDGFRYSEELERLLGESVKTHSELLPRHLIQYTLPDRS